MQRAGQSPPVQLSDTVALFCNSQRAVTLRRVGIEIERIALWPDGKALTYDGGPGRIGAAEMLDAMSVRLGWPRIDNGSGRPVGMASCCGKASLEPGSQLELSTQTMNNLLSLKETARCFEEDVESITARDGILWVGCGVNPVSEVGDMDIIALPRYRIMEKYFSERGTLGTSMMKLTSSVQINLDYANEAEATSMLRAALWLTPLSYALFGNSPWSVGRTTGFLSYRGHIWRNTDAARSGTPDIAFGSDFSFEKYAEHVWSLPLMFREDSRGGMIAADGMSLREIPEGVSPSNEMHAIRQVFTEARLKPGYIEIRSIDGQRTSMRYAAAAFWLGVLYSDGARKLVANAFGGLTAAERDELWEQALRIGLAARFGRMRLLDFAADLVSEARKTLLDRALGEEELLDPLEDLVEQGLNPAQVLLKKFGDNWRERFPEVLRYLAQ